MHAKRCGVVPAAWEPKVESFSIRTATQGKQTYTAGLREESQYKV